LKRSVFLYTLLVGALALPAAGQELPASDADSVGTVTVWGTRVSASSLDLDEGSIALRQADHISDLLRPIPGVDVGGAHSLNQRITIRSLDDRDLRISIDGANQNTYMFHHMGNLQIHADILKSVDVDVGRNSVLNGGLGGAVRFETRSARDLLREGQTFGARAQFSYSDNAADTWSVTGYGQLGDSVDVLAYYNDVSRGNYEVGGGRILDYSGNVVPGTDGKVRGLAGDLRDALVKIGWDLASGHRIKLGFESYEDEGDYSQRPDMGLATGIAIANSLNIPLLWPTKFTRDTLTLNYEFAASGNFSLKAALFHNDSTFWRDERGYINLWPEDAVFREGEADNLGFNVLASQQIGERHGLSYGVDYIDYETHYVVDDAELAGEDARNLAFFVQDEISLGRFTLTPGLRYDRFDLAAHFTDEVYDDVTGALSVRFDATGNLALRLSGTQIFKAPELSEVFIGAGLYDEPNPGIDAETGFNLEFAVNHRAELFGGALRSGVTLFQTNIDNYIYDYAETATFFGKDNVGDIRIRGFEAFVGYEAGHLGSLLTYSRSRSDLEAFADYAIYDNARIDREQGDTLSLELDYEIVTLGLTLHWNSIIVDDLAAGVDLDGASEDNAKKRFDVHNVSARWTPEAIRELSLIVGVDNLFDEFYASQSSRTGLSRHPRFGELYLQDYEPGRNIKATITWQF
jgi:hemoglobin/transferrin/lactoferrin receptor protein